MSNEELLVNFVKASIYDFQIKIDNIKSAEVYKNCDLAHFDQGNIKGLVSAIENLEKMLLFIQVYKKN